MLRVVPSPAAPVELRAAYLASLPEPQELFVEGLFERARKFVLYDADASAIGYAAVSDVTLVELFLVDAEHGAWASALEVVAAAAGVERVLCKTFDAPLLRAATQLEGSRRAEGHLFRRLDTAILSAAPPIALRSAEVADVAAILAMHDGFFDDESEVRAYIGQAGLLVHCDASGELMGCGVRRRVIPGMDAVDVGMVVAPAHRSRGLGARIVASVASRCLAAGDRPICGCAVENVASRRALEAAGFRSDHELVEVRLASASPDYLAVPS